MVTRVVERAETKRGPCRTEGCKRKANQLWLDGDLVLAGLCDKCADAHERDIAEAAMQHARADAHARLRSAVGLAMESWTAKTYPRDKAGRAALTAVRDDWLQPHLAGARCNLILSGPVGSGKTGLAIATGRRLCDEGIPVSFIVWRDALAHLRQSFGRGFDPPDLREFYSVPVLILDDLGAERPTEWARDELATLIEQRYRRQAPMIVTTNLAGEALAQRLGRDDKLIGDRIVSRLQHGAVRVIVDAPDRRRP